MATNFSVVYDSFFSKITDDMFMELEKSDTYQMLEELLMSAISKFEFPRVDLYSFEKMTFEDEGLYDYDENGILTQLPPDYTDGYFNEDLSVEEVNILSTYMIVEWIGFQLATVENIRMKYSGSDFKFTSQANHMQKLIALKSEYEREGFHLQRLYKRRKQNSDGIMKSTFGQIMTPIQED